MNGIEGKNEDIHVPPYLTLFAILYTIFDHIYIYHIAIFAMFRNLNWPFSCVELSASGCLICSRTSS